MNVSALQHIRQAVQRLNPKSVRELSDKNLKIALYAATPADYGRMEDFFVRGLSPERKSQALALLYRGPNPDSVLQFDLAIYDKSVLAPSRALVFHPEKPEELVEEVLENFDHSITLPLARTLPPFRAPYVTQLIRRTSFENAIFSMATALPDIIPTPLELPWAATEFASDTAVLTVNQIKMAFLIAAASDRKVGYREQRAEIATLIGSAFGWRALARQLIGKIPLGGGLIPKAGIAYAGTKVVGLSLERYYRLGYKQTREEREQAYHEAFKQGKRVAGNILKKIRPDLAAKYSRESANEKEHLGTNG
jgi:hypothetical protein